MSRSITLQPCFVWRTFFRSWHKSDCVSELIIFAILSLNYKNWEKKSLKPPASKLWEKLESHPQILPSMRILLFHIVGETHALGNFSTWFFCWFPLPQPLYLGPCSTSNLRFTVNCSILFMSNIPPKILWMGKILVTREHGKTKFKPLVTVKHW